MNYGTLRVKTPDGQVREYPLEVPSVVIGRAESSVVTIEHVSVSRRHAILRIADDGITIEDLGSGTGIYVTGSRIKPGEQVPVEPGSTLRIGEAEATYIAAPAAGDEGGEPAGIARAAAPESEEDTFGVSLKAPSESVAPGSSVTATVTIHNRGETMDEYTIRMPDLPESWVRINRPRLSLMPGVRPTDSVTVHGGRPGACTVPSENIPSPAASAGCHSRPHDITTSASTATMPARSHQPARIPVPRHGEPSRGTHRSPSAGRRHLGGAAVPPVCALFGRRPSTTTGAGSTALAALTRSGHRTRGRVLRCMRGTHRSTGHGRPATA